MLKNVIFDIGNVLMTFDADNYGKVFAKDPATAQKLQDAINATNLWDQVDLGARPIPEIIEEFSHNFPGQEAWAKEAIYKSVDFVIRGDFAIPWLKELHAAGYKTYFLSNYNKYMYETRPDVLDFIPYMDGGFLSFQIQLLKPNREYYQLLCTKYQLKPEECIFLDDRPKNIQAAQNFGMQGLLVKNHPQAYADLKQLLGYDTTRSFDFAIFRT